MPDRNAPSAPRVVVANSGWQLLTFAARAVGGLSAAVLVARLAGPSSLGILHLALAVSALISFAVTLGMPNLLAREVAREPAAARTWLEASLFAALAAGGGIAAAALAAVPLLGSSTAAWAVAIALAALAFDAAGRLLFAGFWALERMRLESFATVTQELAFCAGTVLVLRAELGVLAVLVCYGTSRLLGAGLAWALLCRSLGTVLVPRPHGRFLSGALRRTLPFAADDALSTAYIKVDVVLLALLRGPVAVGIYQAATTLVLSLNVLARVVNNALYPRLCRSWPGAPATFGRLRDASLRILALVGIPIMVGCALLAPRLIDLVYGPQFADAALTLGLLAAVIPVRMLGHTLGTALTAADAQGARTAAVAAAAGVNVGLNLLLIPLWSYNGAAAATVATEGLLMLTYAVLLRRRVGHSGFAPALAVPVVASTALAAAVLASRDAPLPVTVAAGALSYLAVVTAVGLHRARRTGRAGGRAVLAGLVGVAA